MSKQANKIHVLSHEDQELFNRVNEILYSDTSNHVKASRFMNLITARGEPKHINVPHSDEGLTEQLYQLASAWSPTKVDRKTFTDFQIVYDTLQLIESVKREAAVEERKKHQFKIRQMMQIIDHYQSSGSQGGVTLRRVREELFNEDVRLSKLKGGKEQ